MKIELVEAIPVTIPTIRPHHLAMATITEHDLVLVRVVESDGATGVGEVGVIGGYGAESVANVCTAVTDFTPGLVGRDASALAALREILDAVATSSRYAAAALDLACRDLVARRLGVAGQDQFGGSRTDALDLVWILGIGEAAAEIAQAHRMRERHGIVHFLVKVGHPHLEHDLHRVAALRRELGEGVSVRVDANQSGPRPCSRSGCCRRSRSRD